MYEKIDLSNSALSRKEKAKLMKLLIRYRDTFSLRDEIGECPNLEADIKVIMNLHSLSDHFEFLRVTSHLWTNKSKD